MMRRIIAGLFQMLPVLACAAFAIPAALAQGESSVPYVPTPQAVVDRMLDMAKVGPRDYLIDLGSGDGRIVVTAARQFGARGFGVDLNPERIREAVANARTAGVTDKVAFYQRNLFDTDLSEATVITMYLLPRVNMELRPKLLELKPGTRLVSHDFDMGDWKPDQQAQVSAADKYFGSGGESDIYFWVVPARVGGVWQARLAVAGRERNYRISLAQKFQEIYGTVDIDGRSVQMRSAKLRGAELSFGFTADIAGVAVSHEFTGRVDGERIIGEARLTGSRIAALVEWIGERQAGDPGNSGGKR